VRDDLGALIASSGLPAILVTHDLSEALALAPRLALLVDGRVAVAGAVAEALAEPPSLRSARLLGWSATLEVAGYELTDGAALVTLSCGQQLALDARSVAPGALEAPAAALALALRPERLLIERAEDATGAPDPSAARNALRGVIAMSGDEGMPARVALDSARPTLSTSLTLALAPRERATLALADGARVTLRPLPGALRLLPREEAR
jgi:molybdate transport system ATP-binding protein